MANKPSKEQYIKATWQNSANLISMQDTIKGHLLVQGKMLEKLLEKAGVDPEEFAKNVFLELVKEGQIEDTKEAETAKET